ncbi:hypothetical protein SELMODRAFT_422192 [Selaginella moellendorffii]|uniref:F-box domain-containing protein n=1 Tax=Selaginella moellendorffii TaxID=88036 RepID=D8SHM9_SELML|nr:hypothetical protein SELMODRAFT_422192 [Selaginella moellendorffii]
MRLEEPRRRRRWSGEDWAVLPSELLDLILLRLPLLAIVRARSVCKSWNDAIQSPGFAHRKALLDHELGCVPKGWLVTLIGRYKKKWVWLYDPRSGLRHQITLPASLKGTFYEAVVVGGFIFIEAGCVNCDDNFSSRYLAWNPITGFVKELFVPQAGCLAVVSTNRSLKVYSLKPSGGGEESKKILSGLAGSWHRVAFLTYRNQFFFGTYSNGLVYSTKAFRDRTLTAQDMITFKISGVELPPQLERKCRWGLKLLNSEGSLLLLVACTPLRRDGNRMQVWRLIDGAPPGARWEFISAMPEEFYELVFRGKVTQHNWRCAAVDHLVYVSSSHRRVEQQEGVVVLDLRTSRWSKVEPVHHERQHCPWSAPAAFYPSFASLDDSAMPPQPKFSPEDVGTSQPRPAFLRSMV